MRLDLLPCGNDDPVGLLLMFHRRAERHLAELGRLPAHLEAGGVDIAAARTAASLLECFGPGVLRHHADQERMLLPLLAANIPEGGERRSFRLVRAQLEGEHREIERTWRMLRRPLEAIAEGVPRRVSPDEIRYFRTLFMTHVCTEEAIVHRLAPPCTTS